MTVVAAESPHNCHQNTAHTADGLLRHLAWALAYPLSNNSLYSVGEPILALCPEHASLLAGEGLTKADIKRRLFEHGRTPLSWYPDEAIAWRRGQLEDRGHPADLDVVPVAQHWEDIQVMVVGGPGKHSSIIFTFGLTRSVTEPVQEE